MSLAEPVLGRVLQLQLPLQEPAGGVGAQRDVLPARGRGQPIVVALEHANEVLGIGVEPPLYRRAVARVRTEPAGRPSSSANVTSVSEQLRESLPEVLQSR
jgi:hypothetical protein